MSAIRDFDDDEYVAKLLAEDARKSSLKYATMGMSALVPKRPTGAAPKPNTRFLKALVRDADSHNAALKQKEEHEAKGRLRNIRKSEGSHESRRDHGRHHRDSEHRHERERGSDRKRRRLSTDGVDQRRTRHERSERHRTSRRSRSPEHQSRPSREHRHKDEKRRDDSDSAAEDRHPSRSHNHKSARRSTSRSRGSESKSRHSPDNKPHNEHSDRRRSRSRSPSASLTSSDPLSSIIAPKPTDPNLRKKGRGFHHTTHSNIDTRFSSTYDPSRDVDPEDPPSDEEADWDNALEALRDRRAWRTKQADRMREAGFKEDEIKRWETTTTSAKTSRSGAFADRDNEGDLKNVKWAKKGEQREWDAGKVSPVGHSDQDSDDLDNTPGRLGASKKRSQIRVSASANGSASGKTATAAKGNDAWKRPDSALLKQFRNALG
ncbi:hypothetical protein EDD36DRAFT_322305 [Exophiala viscosa]|uniref:Pre-mRNA-splicing factor 38B n=1 Tax=Exophiala viscosa TaxID=2486360 RepID=A0AAN6DP84_9EURO|nr:hypothetical protein EDD36DRAFT_322305 [Exophiala viscosa]